MQIPFISADYIKQHLLYLPLIDGLQEAFSQNNINAPFRHSHEYSTTYEKNSSLLLMPSWEQGNNLGVKLVTVSPGNSHHNLPSVQAIYLLFDMETGCPVVMIDGNELTARRTAAASALASRFLSRQDSKTLMIIGTGRAAKHFIDAHRTVRPIKNILIWGRTPSKAQKLAEDLIHNGLNARSVNTIEEGIDEADVISCATLSDKPLIFGRYLREGQHIDLIGSYQTFAREADSEVMIRSSIYIDTESALQESGDLIIPLKNQEIVNSDILGTLHSLSVNGGLARNDPSEITCFKSVGHAIEDLTAAQILLNIYQKLNSEDDQLSTQR